VRTRALELYIDLHQLCQVTQAGHFPRAVSPLQIARAPLCTCYLRAYLVTQLHRGVLEFELTFHLAQEQGELVWTEQVPVLLPLRRAGLCPATAQSPVF